MINVFHNPLNKSIHLCLDIPNEQYIFQNGKTSTVAILKDAGVSLLDALHWASRGQNNGADMVRLLLSGGADIESRDSYNNTPLVTAVRVSFNFFLSMNNFIFALVSKNFIIICH